MGSGGSPPASGIAAFLATPIAGIPATWLQAGAAVANLGFTPPPNTRTINQRRLLTGGGDLTANRTISTATRRPACTIVANATGGSAVPTAVSLGTGLACSAGTIINTGSGSGDVTGPGSAVSGNIATYNGTTGKIIQDGGLAVGALVPTSRTVTGTGMLAGGGDLSANRTITLAATAANTVVANATGGSAVPTAVTLPACADSGGNHLNYSSGVFSCGTSSSGGGGTPGGSSGQIQWNNASAFHGLGVGNGLSIDTTNKKLNLTGALSDKTGADYTVLAADAGVTFLVGATPTRWRRPARPALAAATASAF